MKKSNTIQMSWVKSQEGECARPSCSNGQLVRVSVNHSERFELWPGSNGASYWILKEKKTIRFGFWKHLCVTAARMDGEDTVAEARTPTGKREVA